MLSPPLEELHAREPDAPPTRASRRARWSRARIHRRRRILAVVAAAFGIALLLASGMLAAQKSTRSAA